MDSALYTSIAVPGGPAQSREQVLRARAEDQKRMRDNRRNEQIRDVQLYLELVGALTRE